MWGKGTNNFLGAILATLWLLWGVNTAANYVIPTVEPVKGEEVAAATPQGAGAAKEEVQPIAVRLASADAEKGKAAAKKCVSCHSFEKGQPAKVGPNLYDVVGGPRAHMQGFAYSDAIKKKEGTWTAEDLDAFLTKPSAFVPGTKMAFAGLPSGKERADIIAYLHTLSPSPKALPKP
jgi:cytochrome c